MEEIVEDMEHQLPAMELHLQGMVPPVVEREDLVAKKSGFPWEDCLVVRKAAEEMEVVEEVVMVPQNPHMGRLQGHLEGETQ